MDSRFIHWNQYKPSIIIRRIFISAKVLPFAAFSFYLGILSSQQIVVIYSTINFVPLKYVTVYFTEVVDCWINHSALQFVISYYVERFRNVYISIVSFH